MKLVEDGKEKSKNETKSDEEKGESLEALLMPKHVKKKAATQDGKAGKI